jgi:hypothetical protein
MTCGDGVDARAARKTGDGLACAGEAEAVRQAADGVAVLKCKRKPH